MRLWHYKLIPVLDNKHLVALWRECIAIKRQWEKGTLKHRLVSYVMDYQKSGFDVYVCRVASEMLKRKIKFNENLLQEIHEFCSGGNAMFNYPEHNDRYLRECLYNLEEKAIRGIITKDEWQKIYDKYGNDFDLWDGEV